MIFANSKINFIPLMIFKNILWIFLCLNFHLHKENSKIYYVHLPTKIYQNKLSSVPKRISAILIKLILAIIISLNLFHILLIISTFF